ncbi:alpha/beta-hydrolase [Lyophyllum atratum]|nr:alpha/beta-hydrolase [Lyophyllum atratum]
MSTFIMDSSSHYKSVTTRRSLKYSYFFSPPTLGKPVLLFIHGFPCTSYDWRYQVDFFKAKGYGLIVPDMLGYGGTDKPTDPAQYAQSLMSQDVIDILDFENVDKVIAIGHDWGSILVSRLANYHPDRFIAFAFLVVSYVYPSDAKLEDVLALTKQLVGYELLGYWAFFSEKDAHEIVEKNMDSFFSLLLAEDPKLWATHLGPSGALKAWLESDRKTTLGSYLTEEEVKVQKEKLLKGGFEAPLCWYKNSVMGLDAEDGKSIPPENLSIQKPVFFGAAMQDVLCLAAMGMGVSQHIKGPLTVKEFNTGHWLMWEERDKLNQELFDWVEGVEKLVHLL